YTGSLFDIPLLASMAWFAGVGAVGGRTKGRTGIQPEAGTAQSAWISWTAMVARLSLPIMAGWAIYGGQAPSEVRNFRMLLTLCVMLLMGALASLKQARSDEELAQANVDLREASLSDLLTGARNRRFLTVSISADIQQVLRAYSGEADPESRRNRDMIFYLIDADHFKEINDHYGHDTGDEVLVEMARRISSAIRNSDVLIRWGGEEFLVLSRYTDRENATALAARVLAAVGGESFTVKGGHTIRRTCSIGWAAFPWFTEHPDTVRYEEVLRLADCALYEAKRIGRNQAVGMLPVGNEPVAVPPRPAEDTPDRSVTHFPVQTVVIQGPQILRADSPVTVAGSKVVPIS
ncbi:MAG TPA: GGDEF domain-containing protein, partial [Terriglobales bacterium]|nr:GGDEF domain-containing protein [Terriglobales bacterium]